MQYATLSFPVSTRQVPESEVSVTRDWHNTIEGAFTMKRHVLLGPGVFLGGWLALSPATKADPILPFTWSASQGQVSIVLNNSLLKEGWTTPDGSFGFTLAEPIYLGPGLGSIDRLTLFGVGDPSVSLAFVASAGSVDTTFTIFSATLPVGLVGPAASASSSLTLIDANGDGASLTGLYGGNAFRAVYNTAVPSVFATLNPSLTAGPSGTTTDSGAATGIIPGTVTDMQVSYRFTLSANDTASGTSLYSISATAVPETSDSLTLAALSGLFLLAVGTAIGRPARQAA